jgi:hypothetical protein
LPALIMQMLRQHGRSRSTGRSIRILRPMIMIASRRA